MLLFSSFLFSFGYLRKTKKKKNKQTKKPHNVELKRVPPQKRAVVSSQCKEREREKRKEKRKEKEKEVCRTHRYSQLTEPRGWGGGGGKKPQNIAKKPPRPKKKKKDHMIAKETART